jgi:hypothetical protein
MSHSDDDALHIARARAPAGPFFAVPLRGCLLLLVRLLPMCERVIINDTGKTVPLVKDRPGQRAAGDWANP